MSCCCHAVLVRLLDQDFRFPGGRLFDLDAHNTPFCPIIDFRANFFFTDIVWPRGAIVLRRLDAVFTPESAEIRSRRKKPGAGCLTSINQIALLQDTLGKKLAGRPGRRHAICEENDAVVDDFLGTALVDEIKVVVGVQINHARHDGVRIRQIDYLSCCEDALLQVGVDLSEDSFTNHDASISPACVADAIE